MRQACCQRGLCVSREVGLSYGLDAARQVDTLLRTAYELQDGLSRSAGHARKPLPSLEQARCLCKPLLSAAWEGRPGRMCVPAPCPMSLHAASAPCLHGKLLQCILNLLTVVHADHDKHSSA